MKDPVASGQLKLSLITGASTVQERERTAVALVRLWSQDAIANEMARVLADLEAAHKEVAALDARLYVLARSRGLRYQR